MQVEMGSALMMGGTEGCSFVLLPCTNTSLCQTTKPAWTASHLGLGCCWALRKATLTDALACPQCCDPIDCSSGMLHAWGPTLEGLSCQ